MLSITVARRFISWVTLTLYTLQFTFNSDMLYRLIVSGTNALLPYRRDRLTFLTES